MLAGYASTPILIVLSCYYEFYSVICTQSNSDKMLMLQQAGIVSMPLILNGLAAVLGFFSSAIIYALLNRRKS